jgi:hypothetical protein
MELWNLDKCYFSNGVMELRLMLFFFSNGVMELCFKKNDTRTRLVMQ